MHQLLHGLAILATLLIAAAPVEARSVEGASVALAAVEGADDSCLQRRTASPAPIKHAEGKLAFQEPEAADPELDEEDPPSDAYGPVRLSAQPLGNHGRYNSRPRLVVDWQSRTPTGGDARAPPAL